MFVKFYKFVPLYILISCSNLSQPLPPIHNELLSNLHYAEKGDCQKALESVAKMKPQNSQDNLVLGKIYKICQQKEKALFYFDEVITNKGKDNATLVEAMEAKGILLLEAGEFHEAEQIFLNTLEKDAARWQTINDLGICFEVQNKLKEALEYYSIAKTLSNNHYIVLNNIALVMAKLKNYHQALVVIDEALEKSSKSEIIRKLSLNKALILSQAGKASQAIALAKKYLNDKEAQENQDFYLRANDL